MVDNRYTGSYDSLDTATWHDDDGDDDDDDNDDNDDVDDGDDDDGSSTT